MCVTGEAAPHEPEPLPPDGLAFAVLLVTVENVVGCALPGACPGVVTFVVSVPKVERVPVVVEDCAVVVMPPVAPVVVETLVVTVALVVVFSVDVGVDDPEPRSSTTWSRNPVLA